MFVFIWENNFEKMTLHYVVSCVGHSVMSDSVTPWTLVHQAPLSMGFSRQEYWSRVPFPIPGNLPVPEIEPESPVLQAESLLSKPPGKPPMLFKPHLFPLPRIFIVNKNSMVLYFPLHIHI